MGKLADMRRERAQITEEYDNSKRQIHANYTRDLENLEKKTRAARRALAQRQREQMNKALELVDKGEV